MRIESIARTPPRDIKPFEHSDPTPTAKEVKHPNSGLRVAIGILRTGRRAGGGDAVLVAHGEDAFPNGDGPPKFIPVVLVVPKAGAAGLFNGALKGDAVACCCS